MIRPLHRERGAGAMSALVGVTVFLALLFFAVQVLYNLYATSVVTAAAFDAARQVAGFAHVDTADAEQRACHVLGDYCSRVDFDWDAEGDFVVLHVSAENPNLLMRGLGAVAPFQTVDRTIRVRLEEPR